MFRPHDPPRPLRGAMIGTGSIAVHHMLGWKAVPGVEIVALANRTREKAVVLGRAFCVPEARVYADYREMLAREELDFVDVATAPYLHREAVLAAAGRGVHVGTVVGVAEHTLLLILAVYKRLTAVHDAVRRGEFDPMAWRPQCHFLQGKTVGLVGFGRIGRRVAHLVNAFEADVIYSDVSPAPADVTTKFGAEHVSFDALLTRADIVSVRAPLTPETRGLEPPRSPG